jgi:hypothetical protein
VIAAPTTGRAVHAEWIKISTLRSTWLTALLALASAVTFALLDYHSTAQHWSRWPATERAAYDPVGAGYSGPVELAILALGTLGVLTAAGEYGTGLIRTTFTATPRRVHVVSAKILIVAGLTAALGEIAAFTIFEAGQHIIAGTGAQVHLTDAHVARAVISAGLYLAASALIGLGLGFVIRRTAGAVAVLFGLFFVSRLLLGAVSQTVAEAALPRVFTSLSAIRAAPPGSYVPSVPAAFAILAAYVVLALGAAYVVVRRRDA